MPHHERRLPHWDVTGRPQFITFRLQGSLPKNRFFPPGQLSTSGQAFVAMDRLLDTAVTGPQYLKIPEIATIIVAALQDGAARFHRYELHAYVVMSNHVHLLVTPNVISAKWLGPLKGHTAYEANRLLKFQNRPFWQDESYDHLVRTPEEFTRVQNYIENNPVTAGLVPSPDQFPWSSAAQRI